MIVLKISATLVGSELIVLSILPFFSFFFSCSFFLAFSDFRICLFTYLFMNSDFSNIMFSLISRGLNFKINNNLCLFKFLFNTEESTIKHDKYLIHAQLIKCPNGLRRYPASIYLFKVNNRNTRKWCEICSKLPIKRLERRH